MPDMIPEELVKALRNESKAYNFAPSSAQREMGRAADLIESQSARIKELEAAQPVRCGECDIGEYCMTRDIFKIARLDENRQYCGAGRKKEG